MGDNDTPRPHTVRPHPAHHHRDEAARARCWACGHPEMLMVTPEDEAVAQKLIDEGYFSTSNKSATVARVDVPTFDEIVTFTDGTPEWLQKELRDLYTARVSNGHWCRVVPDSQVEHLQLTRPQFLAFKRLGGRTSY